MEIVPNTTSLSPCVSYCVKYNVILLWSHPLFHFYLFLNLFHLSILPQGCRLYFLWDGDREASLSWIHSRRWVAPDIQSLRWGPHLQLCVCVWKYSLSCYFIPCPLSALQVLPQRRPGQESATLKNSKNTSSRATMPNPWWNTHPGLPPVPQLLVFCFRSCFHECSRILICVPAFYHFCPDAGVALFLPSSVTVCSYTLFAVCSIFPLLFMVVECGSAE